MRSEIALLEQGQLLALQNVLTSAKMLVLLAFIGLGLAAGEGDWQHFSTNAARRRIQDAGPEYRRSRRHREPSPHFCSWNNPCPLRDDYSPAQQHEIRNRLNPKLSGDSRVFLRVDLED